jgi:hypothetical protein
MANRGIWATGLRTLACAAAAVAFALVGLWWLRLLGLVPDATPLAGIEYLPPSWLLAAVAPAVVLLFASRLRTTAGVLVFAWFAVALFRGDHVLGARSAPSTPGGADVGLLEWHIAGADAAEVSARLLELRPDVTILAGGDRRLLAEVASRLQPWQVLDGGPGATAIVTPHPIRAWRMVELPPEAHRRPVIHAELELLGTRVHAVAVNLDDASPGPLAERLAQSGRRAAARDAGAKFLSDYVGSLTGPVIVGGDLDAPPSTTAVRRLAGVADDLLLADHPVGLVSPGTWEAPVRSDYLFVRDLAPVRSEQIRHSGIGGRDGLFGVARLPAGPKSFARPRENIIPVEG